MRRSRVLAFWLIYLFLVVLDCRPAIAQDPTGGVFRLRRGTTSPPAALYPGQPIWVNNLELWIGTDGTLSGNFWVNPPASTSRAGLVKLAASGGAIAGTVVQGNDSRLSDARVPLAHSAALVTSGTLDAARLPTSGVSAGTYGSTSAIPVFTVDATGRITGVSTVSPPAGPKGDKGDTGATGATGSVGPTGATGAAATVAVGTTSTLTAGSSATVSNVGTTSAAILNFGIPGSVAMRTASATIPALLLNIAATVNVTWSSPFADANYRIAVTPTSSSGLGVTLRVEIVSRTASGCVLRLTSALVLSANAGTLDVIAVKDI